MSFLKYNKTEAKKQADSFGLIAEGEYELYVMKAEWRPLVDKPDKTPYFNLELAIRSDIAQEHGGRKIFHSFYVSRDPEKVENSMNFINRFNLALDIPDGVDFPTEESWLKYIIGKPVRGYVGIHEHNGKKYPEIKEFLLTQFTEMSEQSSNSSGIQKVDKPAAKVDKPKENYTKIDDDPFSNDGGPIDISDDDLPF